MSPGGIHSASVRGGAFVREKGGHEKYLASYLNNLNNQTTFLTRPDKDCLNLDNISQEKRMLMR
jgi:hypothetical protein